MVKISSNLLKAIRSSKEELTSLCRNLIQIKSLSGQENNIANYIEEKMRDLGYDKVQRDNVGNVVGVLEEGKGTPTLMFNGHMDTVSGGELFNWNTDPFQAEVQDDIIIGRGACDMKGALASMILAGALLKKFSRLNGRLIVACVVHEEDFEGLGVRQVIEDFGKPDYVVLGEATDLQIAIGHRGRMEVELEIYGRTSHGSTPEKGLNAIHLMIPVMEKIKRRSIKLPSHPFLGKASVSINRISCSPDETAIVPDKCRIILDRRIIPGEDKRSVLREYEAYMKSDNKDVSFKADIVKSELKCYTGYNEKVECVFPAWINYEDELVRKTKKTLESIFSRKIGLTRWLFSTDGVYTAGTLGIPTIGFGPGEERFAHTPMEQIKVLDLKESLFGYCSIALNLLSK